MNAEIERDFVDQYICKRRRDRIWHELTHEKKRKNAIGRFCHRVEEFIDPRKVIYQGTDMEECVEWIHKFNEEECYIISWDESEDGIIYGALEAIDRMWDNGMASIAVGKKCCMIKTEQEIGAPEWYVLKK